MKGEETVLREAAKKKRFFWEIFPKCGWVGWLIPKQGPNSSKPPQIAQKIAFFDPNFTFRFPKSHKNPGVGGWVNTFGKDLPKKKHFFYTFPYAHWGEAPPLFRVWKIIGWNGILKNHMLTHSGEKSHRCTQCKKTNQESGDLRAHFLIHTGEKPIQLPDPIQEHALRHK